MNIKKIVSCIIIFTCFIWIYTLPVSAAGWGYKKIEDNKPPDIGVYEKFLQDHQAIYRDDTEEKVVYLTFDNGYEEGHTEKILDILKKHDVPATFFITGHYVNSAPELVKRMVKEGHIIGNHSYGHPDFT